MTVNQNYFSITILIEGEKLKYYWLCLSHLSKTSIFGTNKASDQDLHFSLL